MDNNRIYIWQGVDRNQQPQSLAPEEIPGMTFWNTFRHLSFQTQQKSEHQVLVQFISDRIRVSCVWCVYMTYMCMYVEAHMKVRAGCWGCCFNCTSPYCWWYSLTWRLAVSARLAGQWVPWTCLTSHPNAKVRGACNLVWISNLSPHAFRTNPVTHWANSLAIETFHMQEFKSAKWEQLISFIINNWLVACAITGLTE